MSETQVAAASGDDERLAYRGVFTRMLVRPDIGAVIGAITIWAFFWAVAPEFGKVGGFVPVVDVATTLGIMAVAVSLLMIGGEFDLSSGAATGALGIVTILLVKDVGELGGAGLSLWIAIPLSLLAALGLGWFNGAMVERTGLPSFIVTLAAFFVLRGGKLGFSKLIIDNITVGRIDEGHGYGFWRNIFAAEWARNEHQFEQRDFFYTLLVLGGLSLIALAIYEVNFKRKETMNPAGLGAFVAGIAGSIIGVIVMHGTDGVGANTLAGVIIGLSMFVGFVGLAIWRYEAAEKSPLEFPTEVARPTVIGVVLVGLGVLAAIVLDQEEQLTLLDQLNDGLRWVIMLLAGAVVGTLVWKRAAETATADGRTRAIGAAAYLGVATVGFVFAFLFLTTEQGFRAIMFGALVIAGLTLLAVAANRAGRVSAQTRTVVLLLTSLAGVGLAFFIRNESTATKFRSELFTVILMASLLVAIWAVVSGRHVTRKFTDVAADKLGGRLAVWGLVAVILGLVIKLLFTTDVEIEAGIPPAKFRTSLLWFIGVTALATWVLGRTRFGSWIYAVGGNKEAARQIGVPAARTKTQLFMIVSVAAWLVGLILAFRLNTLQSGTGNGLEFEYIIAAVVGGTLLTGGYGSAFGAAIGAFIIAMAKQGIPLARWNSDWRFAFLGVILLIAVIANRFIKEKAEAAR